MFYIEILSSRERLLPQWWLQWALLKISKGLQQLLGKPVHINIRENCQFHLKPSTLIAGFKSYNLQKIKVYFNYCSKIYTCYLEIKNKNPIE